MLSLWELSEKLISYDTESTKDNRACASFLAELIEDIGFETDLIVDKEEGKEKVQIHARVGPKKNDSGLILSGHMDIVPFADQPGWNRDALVLKKDDTHVYGRGTSDMKVFLAQVISSCGELNMRQLKHPLHLIFTCDEEVGCRGAKRLLPRLEEKMTHSGMPAVALIGEPTDFNVYRAHKGVGVFSIKVLGKAGHSSRPDLGKNAIVSMGKVIEEIEKINLELVEKSNSLDGSLYPAWPHCSYNVGKIVGGLASNMIPEYCEVVVCLRSTTSHNEEQMYEELKARVEALPIESVVKVGRPLMAPALLSSDTTSLYGHLKNWSGYQGEEGAPFATDAGFFARLGIDSYICGPGLLSQAHQPNESIPIAHLEKGEALVTEMVRKTCF